MTTTFRLPLTLAIFCCLIRTAHGGGDSSAVADTGRSDTTLSLSALPQAGIQSKKPDRFESFSVLQKRYFKTLIITNLLYAAGYGLYRGVVVPRSEEAEDTDETIRLLPLTLLSQGMMYASVPISAVTANRSKRNFNRYYKEAPRNLTMPFMFGAVGCFVGAAGIGYWQLIKDYQDNNEFDGSYAKYDSAVMGLMDAGNIILFGTNIYALVYVIVLGKKAEKRTDVTSIQIMPMRLGKANGAAIAYDF